MQRPILIAGPTASGKSALALALAERCDGIVANADALQVYDCWRVLSARPSDADLSRAPHALYGHVPAATVYSVGAWLRDLTPLLGSDKRLIIVGGTGLYLSALTRGLAPIPPTPDTIRAEGDALRMTRGLDPFRAYLERHDPEIWARIDRANGMRLQRAWEVHRATGRPLSAWQKDTGKPLISLDTAHPFVLESQPEWLARRIDARFDAMLDQGALEEARANLPGWDPDRPSAKALGGPELVAHLQGKISLQEAVEKGKTATRQFAKRQRTWFRSNMKAWRRLDAGLATDAETISEILSMA
ncbi:tRNA (adenosine(37)-N6)-dimethylallyltransferase MiaA [Halovulum dunhuangense]|nr:tRNA (adenosine(37)-N6)-dimethylallyltransferase MiaA [Halovulum dunhuangense]